MTYSVERDWEQLHPTTARLVAGARVLVLVGDGSRPVERARFGQGTAATVERVERAGRMRVVHTDRGPVTAAPAAEWTVACAHCSDSAAEAADGGVGGMCWDHGGIAGYHRALPETNARRVANGLDPWPIPDEVSRRLAAREVAELEPAPADLTLFDVEPAPAPAEPTAPELDDFLVLADAPAPRRVELAEPVQLRTYTRPDADECGTTLLDVERPELVVIPCGGRKAETPAPAGQLYTGSYHRACRAAADALTPARILILSARHGLVPLDRELAPYEQRMGRPGSITAEQLADQAEQLGAAGLSRVVVLAGEQYTAPLRAIWPALVEPLAGSRGIGEQLGRLSLIRSTGAL